MTNGTSDSSQVEPSDYIITRKRKKYRFALFYNSPLCHEFDEWDTAYEPNVVEIGAGTGLFSAEQAARYGQSRYLAVDVKGDRLQKGASAAEQRGLTNIRFLRARADQLVEKLQPHSVDMVWITFPDPFGKKRSAKRRLTHPNYLQLYKQLLAADGALYFKTDATDLFTWSLEQLVAEGWRIAELSFDLHDSQLADWYKIKTTYEDRFVTEGLKINFVKALPPTK